MLVGNLMPCETFRGGLWGRKHGYVVGAGRCYAMAFRLHRRYNYKRFTLKGWRALWGYRTTEVDSCQSLFHVEPARFLVKKNG